MRARPQNWSHYSRLVRSIAAIKQGFGKRRRIPWEKDCQKWLISSFRTSLFPDGRTYFADVRPCDTPGRTGIPVFHPAHDAGYSSAPLSEGRREQASGCLRLSYLSSPGGNSCSPVAECIQAGEPVFQLIFLPGDQPETGIKSWHCSWYNISKAVNFPYRIPFGSIHSYPSSRGQ